MSLVIESASNSSKGSFVTLFIPGFQPHGRADGLGELTHGLAFIGISSLLRAKQIFIVTVPAVQGLVCVRESLITGSGLGVLDDVVTGLFLLGEDRGFRRENLRIENST